MVHLMKFRQSKDLCNFLEVFHFLDKGFVDSTFIIKVVNKKMFTINSTDLFQSMFYFVFRQ